MESTPRGGRLPEIDVLRGICLVEMMANHLPLNLLTRFVVETAGFISAAEGFVFLSGFVAGWTAFRALAGNHSSKPVLGRFLSRALQLYAVYLALFTIVLASAVVGGPHFAEWRHLCMPGTQSAGEIWIFGAAFLYLPKYLDIFSMYCAFLIFVPLAIGQIGAGRSWLVMAVSGALWAASQFWNIPEPQLPMRFGYFNLFSWQLLFTVGILLGHRKGAGLGRAGESRPVLLVSAGLCLILFVIRHQSMVPWIGPHLPLLPFSKLIEKPTVGLVRLVNFAAMAYCIRFMLRRGGPRLQRLWAYRKLAFLGRHSLPVFSWSIVVTFLALLFGPSWQHLPHAVQVGLVMVTIAALWLPARLHELRRKRRAEVAGEPSFHAPQRTLGYAEQ